MQTELIHSEFIWLVFFPIKNKTMEHTIRYV